MLIQSSLPSSIEAALFFVSDHGKEDILCDWMPGAETWQMCPNCDKHSHHRCRKAESVIEEKENADDPSSLNFPRSYAQPSIVSTMTGSSTPNFVYRRRKLRGNSVALFSAQAPTNIKRSADCLSVTSSDAPSVAAEGQHVGSRVELESKTVGALVLPPLLCNTEPLVSKSEIFDGCSVGEKHVSDAALRNSEQKILEVNSVNDSCSSSKSNAELVSASMKTDVDDTGECSSSSAMVMEVMGEDLSGKGLYISILRSQGRLVGGVWPTKARASAEDVGTSSGSSCSRSCKICDHSETTLKMLICDHCEEAFHMSCCNPRMKKIPIDEWFCHSCLKKKHKILKETATRKPPSITGELGRCRNALANGESNPIALMLQDTEPYITSVRIGKGFQADVPHWSGPINIDVDAIGEPLEMDPSECVVSSHEWNFNKPSTLDSIGNWLQCQGVIDGIGEGVNGTICGKWRRAPLCEVQTNGWECFRAVHWDPIHADCAVPQELETDQVLKQLKYIQMLRPRAPAKRRNLNRTKSDGHSKRPTVDAKNTQRL